MHPCNKIITVLICILFVFKSIAQHPDFLAIDSLKNILLKTQGIQEIDCMNALASEYWWPPTVYPDTILLWANNAEKKSLEINYSKGIATSIMLEGVAEVYKKNLLLSEKKLRRALGVFEAIRDDNGLGWCYIWLGQSLYSQSNFDESLACYETAIPYLDKTNNLEAKGKAWAWMAFIYSTFGNYDSSFYYSSNSLLLRKKMSDHVCIAASLTNMGQLYKAAGAYDEALDYYRQGLAYAKAHGVSQYITNWNYLEPIGLVYRLMNSPDSSYYYLSRAVQIDSSNEMTRVSFAETLLIKNEPDSALQIFQKPIERFRKGNDKWDLMRLMMDIAKAYEKKNKPLTAIPYAQESLLIAQNSKAKHYELDGYLEMSKLYNILSKNDSAYFFMQKFTELKDSILNNQFLWKLSNFKKQEEFKKQIEQLAVLDKQNKEQEEKLRQKSLLQWALIISLLIIALSGLVIYKNLSLKRKNDQLENLQKNSELQQNITELEMQALRAQMNPHFIFNCLSSINRFILKNETEAASNYLTKFSRLIRMVLANSEKQFISLEDELETLRLYLDMERMRFKNAFDYKINFLNSFDEGSIFIPPLLLQPFAENAIWHGLMHKNGHGDLKIELKEEGELLLCTITDNGIGRKKALELKSKSAEKQKSMGIQMTQERLALLNRNDSNTTSFAIEDLYEENGKANGTRVLLKINYKNIIKPTL